MICQREPGARCMYHMDIALHDERPFWLKRPLKGKQSRDARNASLGSATPSTKVSSIKNIQNKDPFVHMIYIYDIYIHDYIHDYI